MGPTGHRGGQAGLLRGSFRGRLLPRDAHARLSPGKLMRAGHLTRCMYTLLPRQVLALDEQVAMVLRLSPWIQSTAGLALAPQ